MHGLANRALQGFIQDTYGDAVWADVAEGAELGFFSFEPMMEYDDTLTFAVVNTAVKKLSKPQSEFLEDLGTYLVSHPNMWRVRRLLRFGGDSFLDFLLSLDDLYDRGRLALPDEPMPRLSVTERGQGVYHLRCGNWPPGIEHILVGAIRAMADDYGALVMLEAIPIGTDLPCARDPDPDGDPVIEVNLLSESFAEGRSFALAAQTA